ncbi:MAG: methyltransferase domain-containing protein [Chthoniobacterales bacterium]
MRKLSPLQWTPVRVAAEAVKFLVAGPGTRVLDIGCGPGKFCLVAATPTDGHFAGVEQRADLAAAARAAANVLGLTNIEIMHGNVTDIAFADYDAFYLFNHLRRTGLRTQDRFRGSAFSDVVQEV